MAACAFRASWRLLYKDGDQWKPVDASGAVRRREGRLEHGPFKPVTTTALRLELMMQPDVSAGVQEWKVK